MCAWQYARHRLCAAGREGDGCRECTRWKLDVLWISGVQQYIDVYFEKRLAELKEEKEAVYSATEPGERGRERVHVIEKRR